MSISRDCDRCGARFKLKAEGSSHFNGVVYRRYADGGEFEDHDDVDFCPLCTKAMMDPTPAGEYSPARTRELEIQNGIVPSDPLMPEPPPQRPQRMGP